MIGPLVLDTISLTSTNIHDEVRNGGLLDQEDDRNESTNDYTFV